MTDFERGYEQGKADALKAREPVAWELRAGNRVLIEITNNPERAHDWKASLNEVVPLYAAPHPWVGLTEEEVRECFKITPDLFLPWHIYARVEAKLKEKNA
jgi:hypothetical protein